MKEDKKLFTPPEPLIIIPAGTSPRVIFEYLARKEAEILWAQNNDLPLKERLDYWKQVIQNYQASKIKYLL